MAKVNNGMCCSIEMEPKTLREEQLNHAREVAADVVQKLHPSEASSIFTQGLRPVIGAKEMELKIGVEEDEKEALPCKLVDYKENAQVIERPCQCNIVSSTTSMEDSLDAIREPLSAPF